MNGGWREWGRRGRACGFPAAKLPPYDRLRKTKRGRIMNRREQGDELDRMRARRRASAHTGRAALAGRRARYQDGGYNSDYDDDYCEDESGSARCSTMSGTQRNTSRSSSERRNIGSAQRSHERPGRSDKRKGSGRDEAALRRKRRIAKKRKRHRVKSLCLLVMVLFLVYGAWMFLHKPTGYWTVAVFGVDSRDGNTDKALADVQIICSIDRSTGEIKLVSVYRDTYLKINSEGTYHKINEAYFKGGAKQAVGALEENLDIKIDDYATFNWKSVAEAINILGGVDLEITPSEFKYINGFITETVESTGIASVHLKQSGMNHLDGVQAVAYCRLRLMDTDFQRTERQRKVISLALDKAKNADAATLTSLAGYLIRQISTSVGIDDILPLIKDINKYRIEETAGFPFSRQNKRMGRMDCVITTTLESNVVLLHQFLYGQEVSYQPSSAVKKISAHISQESGLYEEGKKAPSGGSSSGGASQGTEGGERIPAPLPPAETAPAETLPEEESTEPEEDETVGNDWIEESTEETIGERNEAEIEEIGPGVVNRPTYIPESEEKGPGIEEGSEIKSGERPKKESGLTDLSEGPGSGVR